MRRATGAFAGCWTWRPAAHDAPRAEELLRALRVDGEAQLHVDGALAVAWTASIAIARGQSAVCVLDGAPDVRALVARLSLPAGLPAVEVIAAGFERLREHVLDDLRGEFALLCATASGGLLARDPQGGCPLFVAQLGGGLLFASEVRNLLALLRVTPSLDATALSDWLTRAQVGDGRTLYARIRSVGAVAPLRLHREGWSTFPRRPAYAAPAAIDAAEAAVRLRHGLEEAVAVSLRGAERPGVMLSGGIDSATVSAAAQVTPQGRDLRAYSVVFPGHEAVDEAARIAAVRRKLGFAAVTGTYTGGGSALREAIAFLSTWRLPTENPNLFIWTPLLRRAAADGIDVLLDGEGGDELLGAEPFLIADVLRRGELTAAWRLARRLPGLGGDPPLRWLLRALAKYGLRGALPYRPHELLRRVRARGGPDWGSSELVRDFRLRHDPWAWKRQAGPRWRAHLWHLLVVRPDALGAPVQFRREGAMTGVELRHPLRNAALTELVLSLPPELAYDPHQDRPLARRAMQERLPAEVLGNQVKPFFNPVLAEALRGADAAALRSLLADPHPELARRVREQAVAAMLRDARGGGASWQWAQPLWRIAMIELWLEHLADPAALTERAAALEETPAVSFPANLFED